MVFTATTNTSGENGDKKQNTLPYPCKFWRQEVCLVGAGDESRAFGGAPRSDVINVVLCRPLFRSPTPQGKAFCSHKTAPPSTLVESALSTKTKKHHTGAFCFGAGDESRTRREQLGKLPPYR